MIRQIFIAVSVVAVFALSTPSLSANQKKADFIITIKDHKFRPSRLKVPANERFNIEVVNEDVTPEEFESHDFDREKLIAGKSSVIIAVGRLKPGEYNFFGEFHQDTAQGTIIAE